MLEPCLLILALTQQCPSAIIPKSCADQSKLVFHAGNVVAKQPVDEDNKALTSKTFEVQSE